MSEEGPEGASEHPGAPASAVERAGDADIVPLAPAAPAAAELDQEQGGVVDAGVREEEVVEGGEANGSKVSKSKSKKKKDRKAKKEAVAARQQEPAAAAVKSPPVASSPVQTQLPGKQSELPQPQPPHAAVHKPQEQGVLPQGQPAGARVSVVDNKASGLQKVSSSGTGDVNARIKAHKLRALALKRQGKLEEAKAALAQARALEEEL
eukprot:jgi/Mesvir1/1837/Mv08635-RA.1